MLIAARQHKSRDHGKTWSLEKLEMEIVADESSLTLWFSVSEGRPYVGCDLDCMDGVLSRWPQRIERDDRVVLRIEGKRVEGRLVHVPHGSDEYAVARAERRLPGLRRVKGAGRDFDRVERLVRKLDRRLAKVERPDRHARHGHENEQENERRARWRERDDVGELIGRPVRLHIKARACKLYAFQFAGGSEADGGRKASR